MENPDSNRKIESLENKNLRDLEVKLKELLQKHIQEDGKWENETEAFFTTLDTARQTVADGKNQLKKEFTEGLKDKAIKLIKRWPNEF